MSKVIITKDRVMQHLTKAVKGHKGSINFLINRKDDIKKIWEQMPYTAEQSLNRIWNAE